MKIAIPTESGMVFQHFGHTQTFTFFEVEKNDLLSKSLMNTNGAGHGALAAFLQQQGVQILICGGIGAGAVSALQNAGISVYAGVMGRVEDALTGFLNGSILPNAQPNCHHHEDGQGGAHACGEHGCGSCGH